MNSYQLRIIENAVVIRIAYGESLESVLDSYPMLSEKERWDIEERMGVNAFGN